MSSGKNEVLTAQVVARKVTPSEIEEPELHSVAYWALEKNKNKGRDLTIPALNLILHADGTSSKIHEEGE